MVTIIPLFSMIKLPLCAFFKLCVMAGIGVFYIQTPHYHHYNLLFLILAVTLHFYCLIKNHGKIVCWLPLSLQLPIYSILIFPMYPDLLLIQMRIVFYMQSFQICYGFSTYFSLCLPLFSKHFLRHFFGFLFDRFR